MVTRVDSLSVFEFIDRFENGVLELVKRVFVPVSVAVKLARVVHKEMVYLRQRAMEELGLIALFLGSI